MIETVEAATCAATQFSATNCPKAATAKHLPMAMCMPATALGLEQEGHQVLEAAGDEPGHIMNLGHGILPETPIASVEALVETVASHSRRLV